MQTQIEPDIPRLSPSRLPSAAQHIGVAPGDPVIRLIGLVFHRFNTSVVLPAEFEIACSIRIPVQENSRKQVQFDCLRRPLPNAPR